MMANFLDLLILANDLYFLFDSLSAVKRPFSVDCLMDIGCSKCILSIHSYVRLLSHFNSRTFVKAIYLDFSADVPRGRGSIHIVSVSDTTDAPSQLCLSWMKHPSKGYPGYIN